MALKNLFDMVKADRYTADGREAIIKAQEAETEDATRRTYQIGEISQATGLQKTANGWVKPKNGKQPGAATKRDTDPQTYIVKKNDELRSMFQKEKDPAKKAAMKKALQKQASMMESESFAPGEKAESIGRDEKLNKVRQVLNTALTPSGDKVQMTKSKVTGDFHVLLNGKSTGGGFRDPQKAKEEFNAWIAGKKAPSESAKERINKRFDENEARSQKAMESKPATEEPGPDRDDSPERAAQFAKKIQPGSVIQNAREQSESFEKQRADYLEAYRNETNEDRKDILSSLAFNSEKQRSLYEGIADYNDSVGGWKINNGVANKLHDLQEEQMRFEAKLDKLKSEPGPDRDDSPEREAYERKLSKQQAQRAEDDPRGFGYEEPPMAPAAPRREAVSAGRMMKDLDGNFWSRPEDFKEDITSRGWDVDEMTNEYAVISNEAGSQYEVRFDDHSDDGDLTVRNFKALQIDEDDDDDSLEDAAPSLSEIVDRVYNIGEISEKTGLQKTANGWRPVKKGTAPAKKQEKKGAGIPQATTETFVGKTYKDFVESATPSGYKPTKNTDNPDGSSTTVFEKEGKQLKVDFDKSGKITKVTPGENKPAAAPKLNQVEKVDGANRPYRIKGTQFYFNTPEEAENAILAKNRGGTTYARPSQDPTVNNIQESLGFSLDTPYGGKHSMDDFMKKTGENEYAVNVWSFGTDSKGTLINPLSETDKPNATIKKENGEWRLHYKDRNGKETVVTANGRQDPTRDSAPRVLTGDCRIRIRKEKPALTGDTKIRVRK